MASSLQAINDFETLSSNPIATQDLIQAASRSFQLIEPWAHAQSDNAQMQQILQSAQAEVSKYYKSITQSVETAQAGYNLAEDAEHLCDILMAPLGTYTVEDIQGYIAELRTKALEAHTAATDTASKFRGNREQFNQITKTIAPAITSLETDQRNYDSQIIVAQRGLDRFRRADTIVQSSLGIGIGGLLAVLPHAIIILPVVLPLNALRSWYVGGKKENAVTAREKRRQACEVAMQELRNALEFLSQVGANLNVLAAYWLQMDTALAKIHADVHNLKANALLKPRLMVIKGGWGNVKNKYMEYKKEVAHLQDMHPESRIECR